MAEITYEASALYDGGWRSRDKEQLISQYNLTQQESSVICESLKEIENRK